MRLVILEDLMLSIPNVLQLCRDGLLIRAIQHVARSFSA